MKIRLKEMAVYVNPSNRAKYDRLYGEGYFRDAQGLCDVIGTVNELTVVKTIKSDYCDGFKDLFYVIKHNDCEMKFPVNKCEIIKKD